MAFRVQKQKEQNDSVCCSKPARASIPQSDSIKTIEFISRVFPAVAVESATPSTMEWVTHSDVVSSDKFADGILEAHAQFTIEIPRDPLRPENARD